MNPEKPEPQFCFVVCRYVTDETTNRYWNECYDCVRALYPETEIYFIDDHSPFTPSRTQGKKPMTNAFVIPSELQRGRGELLPIYYFCKMRMARCAVLLHDSIFIQRPISKTFLSTDSYHLMWDAPHNWDPNELIVQILKQMKPVRKMKRVFQNKQSWNMSFGAMAIVNWKFLASVFDGNNYMDVLVENIMSRDHRMALERILGLILCEKGGKTQVVNGSILEQVKGTEACHENSFQNYQQWKINGGKAESSREFPQGGVNMIKVFTGR